MPQGSVLGPLLFLLYINDLPDYISNCEILSFADDTKISSRINSVTDTANLQENLNKIIAWTENNNMKLNNDKFEFICHRLGSTNVNQRMLQVLPFYKENYNYYASSTNLISKSNYVRDLGVFVDSELTWDIHRSKIYKKSRQITGWILNTFYTRQKKPMILLFNSLVRPILEYCCELWSPYKIKDIVMLEQVQRNFTFKIIQNKNLDYWERLVELEISSLQRRREKLILLYVWKIKNQILPNSINLNFKLEKRTKAMKAVIKSLPRIQSKTITKMDESILVRSARLWNKLPANITTINNYQKFKTKLTLFLSKLPDKPPMPGYNYGNNNSVIDVSDH